MITLLFSIPARGKKGGKERRKKYWGGGKRNGGRALLPRREKWPETPMGPLGGKKKKRKLKATPSRPGGGRSEKEKRGDLDLQRTLCRGAERKKEKEDPRTL